MKFSEWVKLKEQAVAAAAPAPASSGTVSSSVGGVGKGTMSSDIKPVPQRLFGSKQTSSCQNCSKDFWKNWYYSKKHKKSNKKSHKKKRRKHKK